MTSPIDDLDPRHEPARHRARGGDRRRARAASSSGYFQAFLCDDEGKLGAPLNATEPIYGAQYLPRKFKVGIAHPDDNSIDVLTQDVGFVPVADGGAATARCSTSTPAAGSGMTHNNPRTAPLLGLYLGRVRARAGGRRGARDRDPAEGERRAQGPQAGALEVHDPAPRRSTR